MSLGTAIPFWLGLLSASTGTAGAAAESSSPYHVGSEFCGEFPKLNLKILNGLCVGLAHQGAPFRLPRRIVQIPDRNQYIVTDVGVRWEDSRSGQLLWIQFDVQPPRVTVLATGLRFPHGLQIGPDGEIYVSELGRIFRFKTETLPAVDIQTVIGGLKDDARSLHPLPHFIFGRSNHDRWDIYLNVGSFTDACEGYIEELTGACLEVEEHGYAQLQKFPYLGAGRWSTTPTTIARGLRNSMGLVSHPSGTLIQLENAQSNLHNHLDSVTEPYDELNIVEPGRHYGYPYCTNFYQPAPFVLQRHPHYECGPNGVFTPPWVLLPPHSAPLDGWIYTGTRLSQLHGKLLMSFRAGGPFGSRVLAVNLDEQGRPELRPLDAPMTMPFTTESGLSAPRAMSPAGGYPRHSHLDEVISGWSGTGGGPKGSPVGLHQDDRGRLWIVDEKNQALLVLDEEPPSRK